MLIIRKEQWDLLSQAELDKFESWVADHVREFFPRQFRSTGEAGIRQLIQLGRKRAAGYGISSRSDVCKYIDFMLVLGRDFDRDSRLSWASEALNKRRDGPARMRALLQAAGTHLKLT